MNTKNRLNLSIGILIISIFFSSCSNEAKREEQLNVEMASFDNDQSADYEQGSTSNYSTDTKYKEKKEVQSEKKKLIKTGNISLKSKHIEKSKSHLDQALKSLNGYYDNEQFSKSNYELRYSLELRIPAKNFDKILQVIDGGMDEIISKNIQTDDVSGEYIDLETRLKSKRAYLKRYEDLLTKAKTMEELLQIEDQIRELIEEIESQESRLSYLDDQVGYSTLNIQLVKVIPNHVTSRDPSFSDNAGSSFSQGWIGVKTFALWLLSIWPMLLILIPAGIFGYRKLKSQKK